MQKYLISTNKGRQLYLSAIQQLEVIEKKFINHSSSSNEPTSFTDRIMQRVTQLWSPLLPTTHDYELDMLKQNEFSNVIQLLERSAREFQQDDALLLLADLNFVSYSIYVIYILYTHVL